MNNTANNILIAEFLGFQATSEGYFDNEGELEGIEKDNTFDVLKFDTDWNWLMEAVEKIESIKGTQIFINGISCEIMFREKVISKHFNTKIEAVNKAVIEFINWHNDNAQK